MFENKIIKTFQNKEYGITSYVSEHVKGYSVSLKDDDCGEFLNTITIYKDIKSAINKAKEIIK